MELLNQDAPAGATLREQIAAVATEEVAAEMFAASESDSISAKNRALQKSHLLFLEIRRLLEAAPAQAHVAPQEPAQDEAGLDASAAQAADSTDHAAAGMIGESAVAESVSGADHLSQELSWYVAAGHEALGPFGFSEMRERAFSGQLEPQTLVVRTGGEAWIEADQDEALRFMLHGSPAPTPAPAPAPTPVIETPREEPRRRGFRSFLKSRA